MNNNQIFTVNIITPEKKVTMNKVIMCQIPTKDGIETFLINHQKDSYIIKEGLCIINHSDKQIKTMNISQGHARFEDNILDICVINATVIDNQH